MVGKDLFHVHGDMVQLCAGKRRADGKIVFPIPTGFVGDDYDLVELPEQGVLWSFTVQRFKPKPPYDGGGPGEAFEPYAVGYVQFGNDIIVEGRIVVDDFDALRIGTEMYTTVEAYAIGEDGDPVYTYAFSPASKRSASDD